MGLLKRDNEGTIETFDAKLSSNNTLKSSSKIIKPNKLAIAEKTKKVPAGNRSKDAGQGTFNLPISDVFQLPPLDILEAPPAAIKIDAADKDALSPKR